MKQVYIGFSRSNKKLPFFSWLVQLYQRTNYSHTYLRIEKKDIDNSTEDLYFQASDGMGNLMTKPEFLNRHKMVIEYKIELDDDVFDLLMSNVYLIMGEKYGFLQNLGILIVDIFKVFNKKIKNPFPNGIICSEFIYELFAPYIDLTDMNKNIVKPKDLQIALERSDNVKKEYN